MARSASREAFRLLARSIYRVRQFLAGFWPELSPHEIVEIRSHLSLAELRLFLEMQQRDRKHCVCVLKHLGRRGRQRELLPGAALSRAALLHDVGKGQLAVWHRVLFVMLGAIAPGPLRLIESEHGAGWRRALWRLRHHAPLGAELVRAAGGDERVAWLVERHTGEPGGDRELAWLIEADEAC